MRHQQSKDGHPVCEIVSPAKEKVGRYAHQVGPWIAAAFFRAQRVLVHDVVDGHHKDRPRKVSANERVVSGIDILVAARTYFS